MVDLGILLILLGMSSIFGVALAASIVVHPILISIKPASAIEIFKPFFDKTHVIVLVLSIVVSLLCLLVSILSGEWSWFLISLLMHLNGPYTVFLMMPLNRRLMADDVDPDSAQSTDDLVKWGSLHAVRTVWNGAVLIALLANVIY